MEQELKIFIVDDQSKTPAQIENNSSETEAVDCFDSQVAVRTESSKTSGDAFEINREVTLSGSYSLTSEQIAGERQIAGNLQSENEFYNLLTQRVL